MNDMESVTPFSNAISYMAWEERNCVRCAKACYATHEPEYDADSNCYWNETYCSIQEALWDGQILGTITADIAKRAGLPGGTVCCEFEPVEADHERAA